MLKRLTTVGTCAAVLALVALSEGIADNYLPGHIHWRRGDNLVSQVYMVDHTGPNWPVNAAVVHWNRASKLGAYYATPDNCPFHCLHVYEAYYGTSGSWANVIGRTTIVVRPNEPDHFLGGLGNTRIRFNNSYGDSASAARRRKTVCHEEGHGIGLAHRTVSTSCMIPGAYETATGDPHDFNVLYNLYNH